jgi:hypothetical protein
MSYTDVFGSNTVPPAGKTEREFTLAANVTLYWPFNYEGEDYLADINQINCTVASDITLPPSADVSVGQDVLIYNVGVATITLKDSVGATVGTVAAGTVKYFYVTSTGWSLFTLGTGTSGADAASLAGSGLEVKNNTLNLEYEGVTTASNYAAADADRSKLIVFTGGASTLTLPAVASLANGWFCVVRNSGTGSVTIDPNLSELVDGTSSKTVNPGESLFLLTNSSSWYTVGYGRSTEYNFTKLVKDITGATATYTLTSSEASNKLLQFVGTPTVNVTMNVPQVVSVYYVQCAYSGTNTLQVKTTAGTGVTLSGSDRVILYCDGTNVVNAQTTSAGSNIAAIDGTVTNPSISFSSDTNTGFFRKTAETIGVSGNGAEVANFSPTGLSVTGTISATGGFAAGTALTTNDNVFVVRDNADTSKQFKLEVSGVGTGTTRTMTVPNVDFTPALQGSVTSAGLTQNTNKLLGRGTASTGAVEEITLGTGLSLSGTTLNASASSTLTIDNKTGAYTAVAGDNGKIINCTSGTFTVSLTAAATLGSGWNCWVWNTGTGVITIDPSASETVGGEATYVLRPGNGRQFACNGTAFLLGASSLPTAGLEVNYDAAYGQSIASGSASIAIGPNSTASGSGAIAVRGTASAANSVAVGRNSASNGSVAATGNAAMALGGSYASGTDSFAAAVANNTSVYGAQGANSIVMGLSCKATTLGSVAIGYNCTVTNNNLGVAIGYAAETTGVHATAMGRDSLSAQSGKYAYGSGMFSAKGDAQTGMMVLRRSTTDATATVLTSDGNAASTTNQVILPNDSTYFFRAHVVARRTDVDGESAAYVFEGCIDRQTNAASTALVGTPSKVVLAEDTAAWDVSVSADTTNGGLAITVTGEAAKTIRWVAMVSTVEVSG